MVHLTIIYTYMHTTMAPQAQSKSLVLIIERIKPLTYIKMYVLDDGLRELGITVI